MKRRHLGMTLKIAAILALSLHSIAAGANGAQQTTQMTDEQIDNLVRRSYQYVAMYNVNNKFALKQGGWNTVDADSSTP
jgi:hypothetical protein